MESIVLNCRYFIAVGLSLAVHIAVIWSVPSKQAFAMPTGSQSSQVNIQFVTPSSPSMSKAKTDLKPKKSKSIEKKPVQKPHPKKAVKKKTKPTPKKAVINKPNITKKSEPVAKQENAKLKQDTALKEVNKEDSTSKNTSDQTASVSKSGVTEKPQLIQKPSFVTKPDAPRYPRIAQRRGIEGTALYEIWLNEKGKQIKQELITSSGTGILDDAALKAIQNWQFSPQIIDGQAIAHRVQIPVRFSLNKS